MAEVGPDGGPDLGDAGFAPTARSVIGDADARRLAATVGVDPAVLDAGTLPVPWHWTAFAPAVATADLGPDGHPRRRAAMAAFPSRMWAGGRVACHQPLRLGGEAERTSAVIRAEEKTGAAGAMWIVTIHHTSRQRGTICIEEDQDLVFRGTGPMPPPGPVVDGAPEVARGGWCEPFVASEVTLFRYSALTFNSHRIHYDRPYATEVEGYQGLVVHGPLTATLLADAARRHGGRPVRSIEFRARAPLFAGSTIWLTGCVTDDGTAAELEAVRDDHAVAMTARVEFASD